MTKTLALTVSCAVLWVAVPSLATAQTLDSFDRHRVESMLEHARDEISSTYYDSTFHGFDLAAEYDTAAARIRAATVIDRAFAAVAQFALDLHDSHTFFVPPQRTVWAEYGWDMAIIGDSCFVLDVASGSDAERQGVRPGDKLLSVNGFQPTRDNLWQLLYLYRLLMPQPALRVAVVSPAGTSRTLALAAKVHEGKNILDLTGRDGGDDIARLIRDAERAEDERRSEVLKYGTDILVWKLPTFAVSEADIRYAFKLARQRKTLVLDLRGNSGGPVSILRTLVGQLSRDSVIVGTQQERRKQVPLIAKGSGDDAFTGQLIVLVDSRSASASEVVARVVQLTSRGRVLGDRTAGAVMRARYHGFALGTQTMVFYGFNITDADLVMADGSRLEGVGVIPDEQILPSAEDLAADRDPVLARALTLVGGSISAAEAGGLLRHREH